MSDVTANEVTTLATGDNVKGADTNDNPALVSLIVVLHVAGQV